MKNTIKVEHKGHTQMIAHRGVSGLELENTHSAFVAAGNRSYYGIEADVHKTADGKFVIIHDGSTKRICDDDIEICKATYDTLRSLLLKQKDGAWGRTDLRIPSLKEYLEICKYYGKKAILELKDDFSAEDIAEICQTAQALDYMEHTVFISFKMNNLLLLKEKYPQQAVQFLIYDEIDDALIQELADRNMGIDAFCDRLTEEIIRKCRSKGIVTNTWTVDDPDLAQKLISWGIDYITSNILE